MAHVVLTHWPVLKHSADPLGHTHSHDALNCFPPVHGLTHVPLQMTLLESVQTHTQLELSVWPDGQLTTQLPPGFGHSVVPLGHVHEQVEVSNCPPLGQLMETQTPPQATKPVVHSHRRAPVSATC